MRTTPWLAVELGDRAVLLELALIEDRDHVAQLLDLAELVRRHDQRGVAGPLDVADEGAHRGGVDRVQARGRLVEDDDLGAAEERLRDAQPLGHAVRQRARVLVGVGLGETDELEHAVASVAGLDPGSCR
jgi:hypothetical protein